MSLFDPRKSSAPATADPQQAHGRSAASQRQAVASRKQLRALVSLLSTNALVHYRTAGKWHRHQLIAECLSYTGPADLYLSSWSMSEDPVRSIYMLRKKGLIRRAELVISERLNERTPEVMQYAWNVFDRIAMQKLHSKVTVLIGDKASLCIVGSDNLTRNPKDESGVIDCHREAVDWRLDHFKKHLKDGRSLKGN